MTNERNLLHETGPREGLIFLALLIPTFVVIAAAAVSLVRPNEPSAAVSAITMAVCGPCQGYGQDGY